MKWCLHSTCLWSLFNLSEMWCSRTRTSLLFSYQTRGFFVCLFVFLFSTSCSILEKMQRWQREEKGQCCSIFTSALTAWHNETYFRLFPGYDLIIFSFKSTNSWEIALTSPWGNPRLLGKVKGLCLGATSKISKQVSALFPGAVKAWVSIRTDLQTLQQQRNL